MADPILAALFISATTYLALLFVIDRRRDVLDIREGASRFLTIAAAVSLAWTAVQLLARLRALNLISWMDPLSLQWVSHYSLLPLALLFLRLTGIFERRKINLTAWTTAGAVLLTAAVLLHELPPRPAEEHFRSQFAFMLLAGGWAVSSTSALVITLLGARGRASPLHRNRSYYWISALLLVTAGQALCWFSQPILSSLFHAAGFVMGCYTQLTHYLPDLRATARRGAGIIIISILTIVIYTAGYAAFQSIEQQAPGISPLLGGAVLAVLMVLLVNPVLSLMQRFLHRLFNRSRYDPNQMLSEYSLSISNILNLEYLAMIVVGIIGQAMDITHGALVIVHHEPSSTGNPGGGSFSLRMISESGQYIGVGRLKDNSPVAYALRREHQPLTQYDIDLLSRFKAMDEDERAFLNSLDIDVYVPIYSGDAWIGLLALGPKKTQERYYKEDLSLLQTLADQTAIALENARLYEDLKQRNTENEILNAELKQANRELERLDEAKSDFITIASHELRTPLTQVIGYNDILGEMVKTGQLNPRDGKRMIESVHKAARRLEEIVETMFDMSKIESRTLDLSCVPVPLASVVNNSIETWKTGINERKQVVTVHGMAHLPAVTCDGKRMTQVFSNLIQNAIKSTPDGGHIRITGRLVEPHDGVPDLNEECVEVTIEDNGIGIAEEDLERIFQKFYRGGSVLLHSSGDTKFKGAGPGLGLTIARGIVEAHGGRIWAESSGFDENLRPGATFHVILPVRRRPVETPVRLADGQR